MFKYMSAEVAPLFTKALKVRFTQPFELNDPFELRPLIDFKATAEEFRGEIDARISEIFGTVHGTLSAMEKQQAGDPNFPKMIVPIHVFRNMIARNPTLGQAFMAEMQRHKAEVLNQITTALVWETLWDKVHSTLGDMLGIFSLSEDSANPLLWSHYASQHYGVVVEFDENDSWFNQRVTLSDDLRHLVQVAYLENPHPRTWKQLNGPDVLYTKNAVWAYEREWRIIRPLKDGVEVSPGKFCFDVPASTVRSMILGCRTSAGVELEIRASVAANPSLSHVSFKRAKLVAGGKIEIVAAASAGI